MSYYTDIDNDIGQELEAERLLAESDTKDMVATYEKAKEARSGEEAVCATCGRKFIKKYKRQAFCNARGNKRHGGRKTMCKDQFWNRRKYWGA